jgi:Type VI secretion system/phage-baseplate injector OB domain
MADVNNQYQKVPQIIQADTVSGIFKGTIVDNTDPLGLGRVRVWIYALHGDAIGIDVETLPWCEVLHSGRGEFAPPELFDRVMVAFEVGDKYHAVVIGYWRANPAGRGKLPHEARKGSEVRPEAWINRGLYPEAHMLGCDGPGNAIWTEAKLINTTNLSSAIELVDTGGKEILIKSLHVNAQSYPPVDQIPSGVGELVTGTYNLCKPTRDGFDPTDESNQSAGSIELNQNNVSRTMQASADGSFSVDQMLQDGGIDQTSFNGLMHKTTQGTGSLNMFDDNVSLTSGSGVFLSNTFATPRRFDK